MIFFGVPHLFNQWRGEAQSRGEREIREEVRFQASEGATKKQTSSAEPESLPSRIYRTLDGVPRNGEWRREHKKKLPSDPNKSKIKFINHAKKKPLFLPAALHSPILSDGKHINMMLPQVVESLTVTNVLGSAPQIYSEQLHTQFSSSTNLKRRPKSPAQELYVQIKDEVADEIIKHGLSKVESKLFFYFLKLDRFGDRPVKVKVAEILLATGVGKSVYHTAIAKFERRGWFGFKPSDVEISNYCTPTKKSEKSESQSEKSESQSEKSESQSEKSESQSLKPLPAQVSKTPQTLQTYSDLLHTLSEDQRESFKKFCLKKIQECSFKIASKEAWLNKHGAEYLEEFKETYSYALANPQIIAPKPLPFEIPDIPELKRLYKDGWKDVAIHYGLIDPDSPEEEIQNESEPVAPSEVTPNPIADSDNPQDPTPSPSMIGSKHRKFAKGNTVVIAEPGNIHKGEKGKVIFTSYGSQEDEYRIALDKESHSVRELTIKIPKPCEFTYLTSFSQSQT